MLMAESSALAFVHTGYGHRLKQEFLDQKGSAWLSGSVAEVKVCCSPNPPAMATLVSCQSTASMFMFWLCLHSCLRNGMAGEVVF